MARNEAELWQALQARVEHSANRPRVKGFDRMVELFERDPERATRYRIEGAGWLLDYAKHLLDDDILDNLRELAEAAGLPAARTALFAGAAINNTEQRPALHCALRAPADHPFAGGAERSALVHDCRTRMLDLADALHEGQRCGADGQRITDLIHIGIGGSHLGPEMAHEALAAFRRPNPIRCHFVANVDGAHIDSLLPKLNPHTTLANIVSKSFATLETRQNALAVRDWLLASGIRQTQLGAHLMAVTGNTDKAADFGIDANLILPMWDWVGGRYSLWSAVGFPLALTLGRSGFEDLLAGAHAMDQHFAQAPPETNLPLTLALLGIWYINFLGAESHAVLPYDHGLRLLAAHLQQLDMESNGKSIRLDGTPATCATGPVIWGGEGTNGQHAYHQLLHQGTRLIPADFICAARPNHARQDQHDWLIANCLSQSQALMEGRSATALVQEMTAAGIDAETARLLGMHRAIPGNRPSSTLMCERITPRSLGALVALYEHKVFCQAVLWHINPFDQWGVELGKVMSEGIHRRLRGEADDDARDASTMALIEQYRRFQTAAPGQDQ